MPTRTMLSVIAGLKFAPRKFLLGATISGSVVLETDWTL
jgi:hypothetical protein